MTGVLVLGRGRLGRTLAGALEAHGASHALAPSRDARPTDADLVLLAVPDHAVGSTAERLAHQGLDGIGAVAHLSGALGLDALAPLAERGVPVGSFHPFKPFPDVRPPAVFEGATVGVDASTPELRDRLRALASTLGAHARHVPDERRAIYHAAAVMASASVVALAARSQRLLRSIGWSDEEALTALLPLMRETIANLAVEGLPGALTGPLRRGDRATVAGHLSALTVDPLALAAYVELARTGVELAGELGVDPVALDGITADLERA